MRIEFDEKGFNYIEIKRSENGVAVIVSSQSEVVPRSSIVNSAEVTVEEFLNLISELDLPDQPSEEEGPED